jgi:hypothetical protein
VATSAINKLEDEMKMVYITTEQENEKAMIAFMKSKARYTLAYRDTLQSAFISLPDNGAVESKFQMRIKLLYVMTDCLKGYHPCLILPLSLSLSLSLPLSLSFFLSLSL